MLFLFLNIHGVISCEYSLKRRLQKRKLSAVLRRPTVQAIAIGKLFKIIDPLKS